MRVDVIIKVRHEDNTPDYRTLTADVEKIYIRTADKFISVCIEKEFITLEVADNKPIDKREGATKQ